jgi:DNA modification methylase
VWNYPGVTKSPALVGDVILDCTKRGQIVLDSFLGSGTTLIAAQQTGRSLYAIGSPRNLDAAVRCWQRLTRNQAIHAASARTFDEIEKEFIRVG